MNGTTNDILVEREVDIAASPETVWEFLTDELLAIRWMGLSADFDLFPGGTYRVEVIPGDIVRGEFLQIEPEHRLAFTWGWEEESMGSVPPGSTTVEIDLTRTEGGTRLRLRHRHLLNHDAATMHARGWDHYLARLVITAAGGDPGTDPWTDGPLS